MSACHDPRRGGPVTFLYENKAPCALVKGAVAESRSRHDRQTRQEYDPIEAFWRERAQRRERAEVHTEAVFVLRPGTRVGPARWVTP